MRQLVGGGPQAAWGAEVEKLRQDPPSPGTPPPVLISSFPRVTRVAVTEWQPPLPTQPGTGCNMCVYMCACKRMKRHVGECAKACQRGT